MGSPVFQYSIHQFVEKHEMSQQLLRAYWPPRHETSDSCAGRLGRFLHEISTLDAVFATWYKLGKSLRLSKKSVIDSASKSSLVELLEGGRNRTDVGKRVIEELGFSVGLWNGLGNSQMAGLNITAGSYSNAKGLGGNCVLLDLPEDLGELGNHERMANLLAITATSWEPNWAGVMSRNAVTGTASADSPIVDWMVYISNEIAIREPRVSAASAVFRVGDIGHIVIIQNFPVDQRNADHINRVRSVRNALGIPDPCPAS